MTNPITPPNELAQQWYRDAENQLAPYYVFVARCAAQWGADHELEACCAWMADETPFKYIDALRAARRPKPPSLKEQALKRLESLEKLAEAMGHDFDDTIRRALEALDD